MRQPTFEEAVAINRIPDHDLQKGDPGDRRFYWRFRLAWSRISSPSERFANYDEAQADAYGAYQNKLAAGGFRHDPQYDSVKTL